MGKRAGVDLVWRGASGKPQDTPEVRFEPDSFIVSVAMVIQGSQPARQIADDCCKAAMAEAVPLQRGQGVVDRGERRGTVARLRTAVGGHRDELQQLRFKPIQFGIGKGDSWAARISVDIGDRRVAAAGDSAPSEIVVTSHCSC